MLAMRVFTDQPYDERVEGNIYNAAERAFEKVGADLDQGFASCIRLSDEYPGETEYFVTMDAAEAVDGGFRWPKEA